METSELGKPSQLRQWLHALSPSAFKPHPVVTCQGVVVGLVLAGWSLSCWLASRHKRLRFKCWTLDYHLEKSLFSPNHTPPNLTQSLICKSLWSAQPLLSLFLFVTISPHPILLPFWKNFLPAPNYLFSTMSPSPHLHSHSTSQIVAYTVHAIYPSFEELNALEFNFEMVFFRDHSPACLHTNFHHCSVFGKKTMPQLQTSFSFRQYYKSWF